MDHHWLISLRSLALGLGLAGSVKPLFDPTSLIAIRVSASLWICASALMLAWDGYLQTSVVTGYFLHLFIVLYRSGLLYVCGERAFTSLPGRRVKVSQIAALLAYAIAHLIWVIIGTLAHQQLACLNILMDTVCDTASATFVLCEVKEVLFVALVTGLNLLFGIRLLKVLLSRGAAVLKFHRNVEHICLQILVSCVLIANLYAVSRRASDGDAFDSPLHSVWILQDALLLILLTEFGCAFANVLHSSLPDHSIVDLEAAHVRLERAERTKSNIIRFLDHELRNNMQRVGYLSDQLMRTTEGRERVRVLESIKTCTAYLATVVEDVLSIDQFESGNVPVKNRVHNIVELVRTELEYLQRYARLHHKLVEIDLSGLPSSYEVFGDPDRVRQVIRVLGENLIGRAPDTPGNGADLTIKATVNGSLELVFRPSFPDAFDVHMNDAYVLLPGEEHRDLSQSLVHRVLRALHGHIALDLERRIGRIVIPLHGDLTVVDSVSVTSAQRKFHMLLVDDDKINRMVLRRLLKQILSNITFDEAEDGEKAVDLVLKEHRVYDIIWMDQVMPHKTGFEACFDIKSVLPTAIVVMVSANDVQAAPEMLLANSADDAIRKPVSKVVVSTILSKYHMLP